MPLQTETRRLPTPVVAQRPTTLRPARVKSAQQTPARLRVLELGSNSFQLHGFEVTQGVAQSRWSHKRRVQLARGVNAGQLSTEYAAAALDAVRWLLSQTQDHSPLLTVATSAVREAQNRETLLDALRKQCDVSVRVLSGAEEAAAAFRGARSTLPSPLGRTLVVDIGGGSTELALGDHTGTQWVHSARVGTLLGERWRAAFKRFAAPCLRSAGAQHPLQLVFASGSARAVQRILLAQQANGTPPTARSRAQRPVACQPLSVAALAQLVPSLAKLSAAQLHNYGVSADRGATLPTGAQLMLASARGAGCEHFTVVDAGLREGIALHAVYGV